MFKKLGNMPDHCCHPIANESHQTFRVWVNAYNNNNNNDVTVSADCNVSL